MGSLSHDGADGFGVVLGANGNAADPVVVLARGDVSKALNVKVQRISATAKQKIEAAGGSVEILPFAVDKRRPRS